MNQKTALFLVLTLAFAILIIGCSNQITNENNNTDLVNKSGEQLIPEPKEILSGEEASYIVNRLIYFGILGPDEINITDIKRDKNDWIISLNNDYSFTMDGFTGIIYCVKPEGQENVCHQAYLTFMNNSIITDTDSFSCVPVGSEAAADTTGMKCHQEIIDEYYSLKEQLLSKQNISGDDSNQIKGSCNKEDNCCESNEDCRYIWFTGGCYTQEYVNQKQKEAKEKGIHIGEAPPRENVTCTCENNKCITHG